MYSQIELHVHPFFGRYGLQDVINAMKKAQLDVLALEALDSSIYPEILTKARELYPKLEEDSFGIKLPDGIYLLNAREYNTKEGFHILTIGCSLDSATPETEIRKIIDYGLERGALVLLDHPFVDNGETRTAGQITENMENELERICKEYSGEIALEWNAYCIPLVRKLLKRGLNIICFGRN